MRALLFLAALALPAAAAPPRKPVATKPVARDWSTALVQLPDGAYRLGNPAAKVKLVEYLSLSCSHCAHFSEAGLPVLIREYVKPGRVSIEFRHAVRDGFDMAASLLVRCGGRARYLRDLEATFAAQPTWIARAANFTPPVGVAEAALPAAFAQAVGLTDLAVARGLPRARAEICLRDPKGQAQLMAMRRDAFETRKLAGTPGFAIDGTLTEAFAWEALQPLLDAALR